MNPGSPDSEFGNSERHGFIVPNYKRQRLQEAFLEFNHAADTTRVRDDEMTSWLGISPLQAENEILDDVDFSSLMENISDEFVHDELLIQPVTGLPQQAETTLVQYVHGEQLPVTLPTLWQSDKFLHGEHQLQSEPAVNQPVINPAPQAENAFWPVLEPPLDISHYNPLDPSLVEPPGFNTNHHYFTAPAVHNSQWPVSPLPDISAPILHEPAAETTPVVAAAEGPVSPLPDSTAPIPVVAAVKGKKERGSTSNIVKEENQVEEHSKVGEQDDGIDSSNRLKRKREIHNESERRRRDKLNERLVQLREIVGCKKPDKASVLEEACTYLKSLQNHVYMLSMRNKMKFGTAMGMGMNMPMAMVPFPAFVPGSTLQNPANTAAQLPFVVNIRGQYFGVYPTGYLQAENKATLQPSSSNNPGEMEDTKEPNK